MSIYSSKWIQVLILSVPVFFCHISFAQQNPFLEFKSISTLNHIDGSRIRYKKVRYAVHDGAMIYAQYLNQKTDDSLYFYQKDLNTNLEKKTGLFVPGLQKLYDPRIVYDAVDFNNKYLIFLLSNILIVADISPDHQYSFRSMIKLENAGYNFDKAILYNDQVILNTNYNYSNPVLKRTYKTCIAVFDIPQNKIIKSIQPKFDIIELTHLGPSNYIHVADSVISFAQSTEVKNKMYDLSLHQTDSFSLNINGWKRLNDKAFDSVLKATDYSIPEWAEYIAKHSNRVFYNYVIDRNTILTGTRMNKDSLEYWLIRKENNTWDIVLRKGFSIQKQEDIKDEIPDKDEWFFYKMTWAQNLFFDDHFVYMIQTMSDKFPWDMTGKDLRAYEEKYYEKNDAIVYLLKAEIR